MVRKTRSHDPATDECRRWGYVADGCPVSADHHVRIAVVDDHAVVRGGIRRLLDEIDHFEVVGEAGTA